MIDGTVCDDLCEPCGEKAWMARIRTLDELVEAAAVAASTASAALAATAKAKTLRRRCGGAAATSG